MKKEKIHVFINTKKNIRIRKLGFFNFIINISFFLILIQIIIVFLKSFYLIIVVFYSMNNAINNFFCQKKIHESEKIILIKNIYIFPS